MDFGLPCPYSPQHEHRTGQAQSWRFSLQPQAKVGQPRGLQSSSKVERGKAGEMLNLQQCVLRPCSGVIAIHGLELGDAVERCFRGRGQCATRPSNTLHSPRKWQFCSHSRSCSSSTSSALCCPPVATFSPWQRNLHVLDLSENIPGQCRM